MGKNIDWFLELRVWFVNVLLVSEISVCTDRMYFTFKIWMENDPTHSQFDCTPVISIFLNEAYFIFWGEMKLIFFKKNN